MCMCVSDLVAKQLFKPTSIKRRTIKVKTALEYYVTSCMTWQMLVTVYKILPGSPSTNEVHAKRKKAKPWQWNISKTR